MEHESSYVINMPDIGTTIDERGIGYVFYHKMKQYKNKIIQIDGVTGEEETYDSFLRRCVRTAITMQKKGVKEDDIIAICSENNMDTVVPYFASMFIGARSVSFPPYSSTQSNIYLVNQTNIAPKILFVSANVLDFAEALIKQQSCEIVVFDSLSDFTSFQEFLQPSPTEDSFRPYEAKIPKALQSCNTTADPQVRRNYVCKCSYDRILMFTNLNWVTTTAYWGVTVLSGGLRIIVPKFDADNFFKLIHTYKPTFMLMGRYLCLSIKPETKGNYDIGSLQTIGINGSALSKEQFLWMKALFPTTKVWSCYGSTEANLIAFPHTETEQEIEFFRTKVMSCGTLLVENILLSHPNVKEAVVVGKRDLIDGDQPMAVVVARGKQAVTEKELVSFVNGKVDDYMKLSGGVVFVDSVPLTSSGKVSRFMTKMLAKDVGQRNR
ncbi:hypothetical protein FQR65_LT01985 [Abscondita terminalis]|nr:hypothetical protein FQR65_LT01985 [Abscondita terminalis]